MANPDFENLKYLQKLGQFSLIEPSITLNSEGTGNIIKYESVLRQLLRLDWGFLVQSKQDKYIKEVINGIN